LSGLRLYLQSDRDKTLQPYWISENINNSKLDRVAAIAPNLVGRCITAIGCDRRPKVETGSLFTWRHQM